MVRGAFPKLGVVNNSKFNLVLLSKFNWYCYSSPVNIKFTLVLLLTLAFIGIAI